MTVEELLRHISALKDFAVRVGRNPVLEDELAQMIQKLPPQSLHDISRIANLIDDSFGEKKTMLLEILQSKVATTAASGKNRTLQTWKELAKYLHKAHWDMILDPSVPRTHVMREIVKHMYEVGLRYPSEVTMGYLSILVSFKDRVWGVGSWEVPRLLPISPADEKWDSLPLGKFAKEDTGWWKHIFADDFARKSGRFTLLVSLGPGESRPSKGRPWASSPHGFGFAFAQNS